MNIAAQTVTHRLAPEFKFPQAINDVDNAIRWVNAKKAEYHLDVSKIVIIGESAGGFLVNYAGTHETKIAAVVDFYGPVDYAKWLCCGATIPNASTWPV